MIKHNNNDIAIIGVACRFPAGANSIEEYWELLVSGADGISTVPKERWDLDTYYSPDESIPGKMYCRWGGFFEGIHAYEFDASLFEIPAIEAQTMDPQQRFILEVSWEALESAGINPRELEDSNTSVFIGFSTNDYANVIKTSSANNITAYTNTGSLSSVIAGRVSYTYGLKGPSMTIDTACSSSLVALDRACASLNSNESYMSIVGGVSIMLDPDTTVGFCKGGFLSRTGACRTFDDKADGYVRGEGCGVIILKKLSNAIKDNDKIYAVIKSSAVNQDGASAGLTVPNGPAQEEVITKALEKAQVEPKEIQYIEAHGTGTPLGDPIEVESILNVLQNERDKSDQLVIGSVKTNIGHLEAAAGMAGLIKVIMSMRHKLIPKNLHFNTLNKHIYIPESLNVNIPNKNTSWEYNGTCPRLAGISAFAFQGTNAHVILQEYTGKSNTQKPAATKEPPNYLLPISANSDFSLNLLLKEYKQYLEKTQERLLDICYTASVGRAHLQLRTIFIGRDKKEIIEQIQQYLNYQELSLSIAENKIAQDYLNSNEIDWIKLYNGYYPNKVKLPTYQFDRRRYWLEQLGDTYSEALDLRHPIVHNRIFLANSNKDILEAKISISKTPELDEHKVYGISVFPAVGYLELILCGMLSREPESVVSITNVSFEKAISANENDIRDIQVAFDNIGSGYDVSIHSADFSDKNDGFFLEKSWDTNVTAYSEYVSKNSIEKSDLNIEKLKSSLNTHIDNAKFEEIMSNLGMGFGGRFRGFKEIYIGHGEALGFVDLKGYDDEIGLYHSYPGIFDLGFQLLISQLPFPDESFGSAKLPISIDSLTYYKSLTSKIYVYIQTNMDQESSSKTGDILLVDVNGNKIVEIRGLKAIEAPRHTILESLEKQYSIPLYVSQWLSKENYSEDAANNVKPKTLFITNAANSVNANEDLMRFFNETELDEMDIEFACDERTNFEDLIAEHKPERIVYNIVHKNSDDIMCEQKHVYYYPLLNLCQNIKKHIDNNKENLPIKLFVVSGYEISNLSFNTVYGLIKSVQQENPDIEIKVILIDKAFEEKKLLIDELRDINSENIVLLSKEVSVLRLLEYKVPFKEHSELMFNADKAYIITGGVGGLGITIADWMLSRGAKSIVLISRNTPNAIVSKKIIEMNEMYNAEVVHKILDVSNLNNLKSLFLQINKSKPISGIIHAAGILSDNLMQNQTWEDFVKVAEPKILGSYNMCKVLEICSKEISIDYLVMFSSQASMLGNIGQTNYAAANSFMDGICTWCRTLGIPAYSIDWGPWANVGMAARSNFSSQMSLAGINEISTNQCIYTLEKLIGGFTDAKMHFPGVIGAFDINWKRFVPEIYSDKTPKYLSQVFNSRLDSSKSANKLKKSSIILELESATDDMRKGILEDYLLVELKSVLGDQAKSEITKKIGFMDVGVNSLLAIEYRKKLRNSFDGFAKITATAAFDYPNISAMSDFILEQLKFDDGKNRDDSDKPEMHFNKNRQSTANEPIAIIGMSCRFPGGANNLQSYWNFLENGNDGISKVPKDRWNLDDYYDSDPGAPGKVYTKWGGFLKDIDVSEFDADFFDITPLEAKYMDPQQRMLLEVSWEALENAKINPEEIRGQLGAVFIGQGTYDFSYIAASRPDTIGAFSNSGISSSVSAGRLSFYYGLQGPSMTIDTACSSSLIAVHQACCSLQSGESNIAIAGGVNLNLSPIWTIGFCKSQMLSKDGKCKTFDADADGYARGEGCGVVILKRLSDARRDNDRILGIIPGSATNQDGASGGLTVPNGPAQQAVIRAALEKAKYKPERISYIEAHGTGTSLGDPIEVQAISSVYCENREDNNTLYLSSVKTNFGHLETAAGMASLIKVVLSLINKKIPKHLHLNNLNPMIDIEDVPIKIPGETCEWDSANVSRVAGVSGFAFQGSNAHVLVEEYKNNLHQSSRQESGQSVLPISAKSQESLNKLLNKYVDYLQETEDNIKDICYTASCCRAHFKLRIAFVADNTLEMLEKVKLYIGTLELDKTSIENEIISRYLDGEAIEWNSMYDKYNNKVDIPTYAFSENKFWLEFASTNAIDYEANENIFYSVEWLKRDLELNEEAKIISFVKVNKIDDINNILNDTTHIVIDMREQENDFCLRLYYTNNEIILNVVSRIVELGIQTDVILLVLTRYSSGYDYKSTINLNTCQLSGILNSVSIEYPALRYKIIDSGDGASYINEEFITLDGAREVTYRDGNRYVPSLEYNESLNNEIDIISSDDFDLDFAGTYIVTGGFGGIGKKIIQWLLLNNCNSIVIFGRSKLDETKRAQIVDWENAGAVIKYISIDISDKSALDKAFVSLLNDSLNITGIFHLAGSMPSSLVINKDMSAYTEAASTKVVGSKNLNDCLAKHNIIPKRFVHFSSSSSILGGMGQSAYASANAFIDKFVLYQRQNGVNAINISWGPWLGTGIASRLGNSLAEDDDNNTLSAIESSDATNALSVALRNVNDNNFQFIIMKMNWPSYFNNFIELGTNENNNLLHSIYETTNYIQQDELEDNDYVLEIKSLSKNDALARIYTDIKNLCVSVVGSNTVDLTKDTGFMDAGFTSLIAVEFRNNLLKMFGKKYKNLMPTTLVFDYPTLGKLAQYLNSFITAEDTVTVDTKTLSDEEILEKLKIIKGKFDEK